MQEQISSLLEYLCRANGNTAVIEWAPPIPAFGDPSTAQVATLGLNPSNREFVDQQGNELGISQRRFPNLRSLGLSQWDDITDAHIVQIATACRLYFQNNPYNRWFKPLDFILSATETSFYTPFSNAVHLDIIPYATWQKWSGLSREDKQLLAGAAGNQLGLTVRDTPATLVVLNGMAVVRAFQCLCDIHLYREEQPSWALVRSNGSATRGYSFRGATKNVGDVALGREVLVLGFNHNIQSSFGISTRICDAIRNWIRTEWSREL